MKIKTNCGTTKTVGPKTFEIIMPDNNNPPVFEAGFFNNWDLAGFEPINQVVVGSYVNLRVIQDPRPTPPHPYDPDGDGIIYIWDWDNSSSWLQYVYNEKFGYNYEDHYNMIKADVLGHHTIKVTAMDTRGATSSKTVSLDVVPPNPVPQIDLPPKVVEGRPFTPDISGSRSYSPGGYAIKQYIWGNKLSIYPSPGQQTVTLDVVDSNGLHAISPAQATLNVLPDLPPKAQLAYNATGVRGVSMSFKDTSYSPDDDPIGSHTDTLTCDVNNNGSYADDVSKVLIRDASGSFTYTPTQVGKCRIRVYIDEATPQHKSAQQDYVIDVVNDNPTATFTMAGEVTPPALNLPTAITPDMLLSASWRSGSLDGDVGKAWYKNSSGNLQTLPIYDTPAYSNMMTAANAPDPGALTVRDATKEEIDAVALGEDIKIISDTSNHRYVVQKNGVTIRTISNPYWSYRYYSTPDYLYFLVGDGSGANGCSSTYNTYLRYPINRLMDLTYSPGTFYTCSNSSNQFMDALAPNNHYSMYGTPVYSISSAWNYSQGYTEWFVSKVLDGGTVWSLKEPGALSSTTVLNANLSKLAYTMTDTNVHLRVRNTADGRSLQRCCHYQRNFQ
uniref:PKD/Chitinase domain-containing protein n=2 Tax=Paenibacillus athensensis TaxID=1967502 RepID=A0A4Y8PPT7_9BACL